MVWALAHGQLGGSGGMLPRKFGNLDTLRTFLMHSDTCFGTNFNTAYNEKPIASTV